MMDDNMKQSNPELDNVERERQQLALQKKLLVMVVVMGVVMLLLFFGLIGGLIYKMNQRSEAAAVREVALGLPQGSQLRQTTLQGDKLIIETGQDIFIYNISNGRQLFHVNVSPR